MCDGGCKAGWTGITCDQSNIQCTCFKQGIKNLIKIPETELEIRFDTFLIIETVVYSTIII